MDAEERQTRGRRRRKDVPFHRWGGRKHISQCLCNCIYIYIYWLNQGSRRRKDVPFHRGGAGKHVAGGEGRMSRSTVGQKYIVMPIVYKLNQRGEGAGLPGRNHIYIYIYILVEPGQQEKEGRPVPQRGSGETCGRRRRKDVPFYRGGGAKHVSLCLIYKLNWGAGEGRMSRSTAAGRGKYVAAGEGRIPTGGEGGTIYRHAYIITYKLNQGSRRRKDVPFHRGKGGETCGRRRRKDVSFHSGANIYRYAHCI